MTAAPAPVSAGLSPVVAGAWRLAEWGGSTQDRLRWIEQRLALGITSFDHADAQGDWRVAALFGQALAADRRLRARMQLVCTVAAPSPAADVRQGVRRDVQAALDALGTDWLDLLLIRPGPGPWTGEALAEALDDLHRAGQVRGFGVNGACIEQARTLHRLVPLAALQLEFSLLHQDPRRDGTLDTAAALGLQTMAWAPLAGGRIFMGRDGRARRLREVLATQSRRLGVSATALALAWVTGGPAAAVPVVGARRIEVMVDAMTATRLVLDGTTVHALSEAAV